MFYCKYCYRMLEDGTEVCTACGKPLTEETMKRDALQKTRKNAGFLDKVKTLLGIKHDNFGPENVPQPQMNSAFDSPKPTNLYNTKDLAKSKYSNLPRKYTIDGVEYDIDNPDDIVKIPLFNNTFIIDGFEYGMDSILFDHGSQAYEVNKEVYRAAFDKYYQYRHNGICHKSKRELEIEEKSKISEKAKEERREQIASFQAEDMYQFSDIPFCWHYIKSLRYTNGVAWSMLNTNNQVIAKQYISQINDFIIDAHDYIEGISDLFINLDDLDFNYSVPAHRFSMANTRIECYPYTRTGKISKFPVILKFATLEIVKEINDIEVKIHPISGEIKILKDGNIGSADVFFFEKTTHFEFRLYGLSLVLKRVSNSDRVLFDFAKTKDDLL